jgi:hypothetical protein
MIIIPTLYPNLYFEFRYIKFRIHRPTLYLLDNSGVELSSGAVE